MSNSDQIDTPYCWCGTQMTAPEYEKFWLCSAHGKQERAYGPTPNLPTAPHA